MTQKQGHKSSWLGIIVGVCLICFASCQKPTDTLVSVTVLNDKNAPMLGADVRLWHGGEGDRIDESSVTDGAGEALFNLTDYYVHGQAGLAVLDIDVTWQDTTQRLGFVEVIEEGERLEEIVVYD